MVFFKYPSKIDKNIFNSQHETKAFYGLPLEVKFCPKCVISNQRPSSAIEFKNNSRIKKQTINFDKDGICDACKYHSIKYKTISWSKREKELFRSQRKAVEAGAHGTLEYTIKKGVNRNKIADDKILKSKK